MLAILKDPDTTRFLFEYILETPTGRRSVSRLARTCKAFYEPASDVLWKHLDSLTPLLGLMPSNLFKRPRRPGLGFTKMPEKDDWHRLLAQGQRVRKITYHETAGNVSPSIFSVIEEYRPQDYILPNLSTLIWRAETSDGLERSLLFLIPELQSLTVEMGTRIPQQEVEEFLTELSNHTQLSTLSVTSSTRLPDRLPRLLQPLNSLQKIALMAPGALSPSIGRWLSNLPALSSLQMDLTGRSDAVISAFLDQKSKSGMSSPDVRTPDSGVFSGEELDTSSWSFAETEKSIGVVWDSVRRGYEGLLHLNLTGDATSIATFISRINSPIQHLELVLEDPEEESDWRVLCSTIQRRFRNSLQSFQVTATGSSRFADLVRSTARGESASRRLPLDTLSSLPHLLRFEIDLPESVILHNDDIMHLAAACPNLETIKLCPVSRWPVAYGPPKLTLAGLAAVTAGCKRLHTLTVPIHATEVEDNEDVFGSDVSSRSLLRLHVGHSWADDPLRAGILLSNLAPHLESLKWFHEKNRPGYVEANNLAWQKVSEILPQLQRLRLRERRQAQAATIFTPVPTPAPAPAPAQVVISTVDKSIDATQKVKTSSRGVLAKPSTVDHSVWARPRVSHRNVQMKPDVRSQEVDATREIRDQEVTAVAIATDQSSQTQALVVSTATDATTTSPTNSIGTMTSLAAERPKEQGYPPASSYHPTPPSVFNSVGDRIRSLFSIVRSVSPPILLRVFDMFSIFTPNSSSRGYSDEMIASMRSPLLFSSKISPVCH